MNVQDGRMTMRERVALGMVLAVCAMAQAEVWTLKEPRAWARDGKAVSMKALGGGAFELRHTGGADWCCLRRWCCFR